MDILNFALLCALVGVAYGLYTTTWVLKQDPGSPRMQEISAAVQEGAAAFLNRQYKTVAMVGAVLFILLFGLGKYTAIGFVIGAVGSAACGYIGMYVAVRGNVRTAQAAFKSMDFALTVAFRGGSVTGLLVVGLGLLGVAGYYKFLTGIAKVDPVTAMHAMVGLGFGCSLVSVFARLGGGIYTKAADVGADLVGKVEAGIPEDDPRNAAVIADNVGDNVGDCAGMAADIFESYEVTIVSALILGLVLYQATGQIHYIVYPLVIRAIGVISSIIGTFTVPIWERFPIKFLRAHDAEEAMFRSYEVSSVNTVIFSFLLAILYAGDWRLGLLTTIGVGLAVAFNPLTSYFTATRKAPVQEIVKSTRTGPATTILSGLSVGMESSVWALVVIAVSFTLAKLIYQADGANFVLYAVAMIGIGMLSHTGNNVAMDSYGPISDNANGIAEMAWHDMDDPETLKARQIMADLDAVGNTTKAITKGIAIASAVIAAVSLFASYITDVNRAKSGAMEAIRISDTTVFIGFLLGGALPWLFSSLSIRAVSRAASEIVEEVRKQFRVPGIMEGTVKPDYAKVVSISTRSAQKELIPLAVISITMPLLVGLVLQVEALGGYLAGVILSGQLLAVFMANAGGAWDNAKKAIEDEPRSLEMNTGKGSERHKAGVVGDTVGDPLKDTAGPALNPMIKVVNLVSLLAAPIIVNFQLNSFVGIVVVLILFAGFVWAIFQSKRPVPDVDKPI